MNYIELPDVRRAQIYVTDRLISMESASGHILFVPDPAGYRAYLSPEISDEDFGTALFAALAQSRVVAPGAEGDLYDEDRLDKAYEAWIEEIKARYGYGSKRAVLKGMLYCSGRMMHGEIVIMPTQHTKLESWVRRDEDKYVTIPATVCAEEAGAAVRLALSRCI